MSGGRGLLDRGALTDAVLDHVSTQLAAATGVTVGKVPPLGDHVAPKEGGWVNGQPGSGLFVPYVVLKTGGGAPRALSPATTDPAWAMNFTFVSNGGSRAQCDWMSRALYEAVAGLKNTRFGDPAWKVINVEWSALGAMLRNDATDPPFWSVSDTVLLVCDA